MIVAGAAGAIQLMNYYFSKTATLSGQMMAARDSGISSTAASPSMQNAVMETTKQAAQNIQSISPYSNIALWFLAGAMFALLAYLIISLMRKDVD